jgi:hypothetical protein
VFPLKYDLGFHILEDVILHIQLRQYLKSCTVNDDLKCRTNLSVSTTHRDGPGFLMDWII